MTVDNATFAASARRARVAAVRSGARRQEQRKCRASTPAEHRCAREGMTVERS